MQTKLNPYLNFQDNARQAMEFYQSIFGGKLDISTFKDYHASQDPAEDDKVMHSVLETDGGLSFMASDTPNGMEFSGSHGFGMSLTGHNEVELKGYFEKLSDGGKVTMPMEKAPWGDTFGMAIDKFGVCWMVNISGELPAQAA